MPADLVFVNGPIFTAGPARAFVRGLAVSGERITALGEEREVIAEAGADTRVIDLAGRMMAPGFQDAHCHPDSGLDLLRCSFEGCDDGEDAVAYVARYAAEHPDREWILGSGWQQVWFPRACPTKQALDAVVADRPVLVYNADGHGAWVNSVALKLAGIDATTPDPPGGRIERDEDGEPQGTLHEGAASLVLTFAPDDTDEEIRSGIVAGQKYLLSRGITTWQDAHVDAPIHRAYRDLAGSGDLVATAVGALWWDRNQGIEQIEALEQMRAEPLGRYLPLNVKLMLDGVVENHTASMLDPYLDGEGGITANRGMDFIEPGQLREIVTELDRRSFSCHFHAIGDAAVRNALDAVEAARLANGWSSARHQICHLQVVHPDDIPRFRRLGVLANAQAFWAQDGDDQHDLTLPYLGEDRAGWQYPFASLLREGATLAMGSDWGVTTADVMDQVDAAVTRSNHDHPELPPLNAGERISFLDAITGFTAGSAYANHRDGLTGTLGIGMLADLVVLDRDPMAGGLIREASVSMTVADGRVVYEGE